MDLTSPKFVPGQQVIEAYGGGGFRVSGTSYRGSVLVLPEITLSWPVLDLADLTFESFQELFLQDFSAEILLLGCGPSLGLMTADLRAAVRAQGPVIEPMDTGAACRTFNVLMMEGRSVAAALIAID